MNIRGLSEKDIPAISFISKQLYPKWFDENALRNIPMDAQIGKTFVAEINEKVRGFIVISSLEGKAWINWMAVEPEYQGQGVGTALLNEAERLLLGLGMKDFRVDTVVEQFPDDNSYDLTIKFYKRNGFMVEKKHSQQLAGEFKYRRGVLHKRLSR